MRSDPMPHPVGFRRRIGSYLAGSLNNVEGCWCSLICLPPALPTTHSRAPAHKVHYLKCITRESPADCALQRLHDKGQVTLTPSVVMDMALCGLTLPNRRRIYQTRTYTHCTYRHSYFVSHVLLTCHPQSHNSLSYDSAGRFSANMAPPELPSPQKGTGIHPKYFLAFSRMMPSSIYHAKMRIQGLCFKM